MGPPGTRPVAPIGGSAMTLPARRSPAPVGVDTPIRAVARPWVYDGATGDVFALPADAPQPVRLFPPARLVWESASEWTTPRRVAEDLVGRGGIRLEDVPAAAAFPSLVATQADTLVEIGLMEVAGARL